MSALQRTACLAQAALRRPTLSQNPARFLLTQAEKAKRDAIRAKFQAEGDLPVYLRGGPMDKALFNLTRLLVGIGVLHSVWRVYCRMGQ